MYNNKNVLYKNNKGKIIVKKLFNKIKKNPGKFLSRKELSVNKYRAISDFISGMTDRYAINLNNSIR
jgi:dGTPase